MAGSFIYDEIPKSIASNINEVKIYTPPKAKYQVIEKDPKILIIFDNVTSGETNTISYLINKPLDETAINDFKTPTLFVKSIIEGVPKEIKVESKKGKYNWVWYVVSIIIVSFVLIYLITKKRDNKPKGNKLKKR